MGAKLLADIAPGLDVSEHGLFQLRIHFVCDGDNVQQHLAEIYSGQVVLQGVEDADLQDSRFLHHHRGRVALSLAQISVLACCDGDVCLGIGRET
jgi:hypothetical protein